MILQITKSTIHMLNSFRKQKKHRCMFYLFSLSSVAHRADNRYVTNGTAVGTKGAGGGVGVDILFFSYVSTH